MVTFNVYGLDQFVVGELSARISKDIAKIYEVDPDEVHFISSSNMVFHNGNEQTSWRVIIEVLAPKKVEVLQEQMCNLLEHYISEVAIHLEVVFRYYSVDHYHKKLNSDYPLFLEDKNLVNFDEEYNEDMEEGEEEDEIYTGDIFEGLKGRNN